MLHLALGLQELHRHGFIHRDIKPDNLFLKKGKDGELVLVIGDMGLTRSVDQQQQNGYYNSTFGHFLYSSPDTAAGRVSAKGDMW